MNEFIRIPLQGKYGEGKFMLIDKCDLKILDGSNVHLSRGIYPAFSKKGSGQYVHRAIMNAPKGLQVDHINRDTLDNRRCNLRLATNAQNHWNWKKAGEGQWSKFKGVWFWGRKGKWVAEITKNGKRARLKHFETELEAAKAYDSWAEELFGEFALTNKMLGLL